MTTLTLLLHQPWQGGDAYSGDIWGLFHPGLFWVGMLLLFAFRRRAGRCWSPASGRSPHRAQPDRHRAAGVPAAMPPAEGSADSGPLWPDLYPEAPARPATPPGEQTTGRE